MNADVSSSESAFKGVNRSAGNLVWHRRSGKQEDEDGLHSRQESAAQHNPIGIVFCQIPAQRPKNNGSVE
jgi:hypothetical protein